MCREWAAPATRPSVAYLLRSRPTHKTGDNSVEQDEQFALSLQAEPALVVLQRVLATLQSSLLVPGVLLELVALVLQCDDVRPGDFMLPRRKRRR